MTSPQVTCRKCGSGQVRIETRNGQDTVWCKAPDCGLYSHNAPRTETGRTVRTLRRRPDIRPSKRSRILDRDNGACIICHRPDADLDVGHLISVEDGKKLGMTEAELYDEENLAAMCSSCNSGYGSMSISPRILLGLIRARINRREGVA